MAWPATAFTQWNAGHTSSPAAVPTSPTALETGQCWLGGVCFVNTSGVIRTVTVRDAAGVAVLSAVDLPSDGVPFQMAFGLMPMLGITWFASGAGVSGAVWGSK